MEEHGYDHEWMSPKDGEENIISEVVMGEYRITAYKVNDSALSEDAAEDGYEIIRTSPVNSTVIISSSLMKDMVESSPSAFHGAYTIGVFVGQTLTLEIMRLAEAEGDVLQ